MIVKNLKALLIIVLITFANTANAGIRDSYYTSYTWSRWHYHDAYMHASGNWVYVFKNEPNNFLFRFNISELVISKLTYKEWMTLKSQGGSIDAKCKFEYYITDECPTMKSCLEKYGYPCAKEKLYTWEKRPSVLQSEYVSTSIHYISRDKINTLNFFFADGSAYAIAVDWTITKNGGIVNREVEF